MSLQNVYVLNAISIRVANTDIVGDCALLKIGEKRNTHLSRVECVPWTVSNEELLVDPLYLYA